MKEGSTISQRLVLLSRLNNCLNTDQPIRPVQTWSKISNKEIELVLEKPSTPMTFSAHFAKSPEPLSPDELRLISENSEVESNNEASLAMRRILLNKLIRYDAKKLFDEIALIRGSGLSNKIKFDFFSYIASQSYKYLSLEDFLLIEKELIEQLILGIEHTKEFVSCVDEFIFELPNPIKALELAYKAGKGEGGSIAIIMLAETSPSHEEKAKIYRLAVKTGRKDVLSLLREKRIGTKLFEEVIVPEAIARFYKLAPDNMEKMKKLTLEKSKRLFLPLLDCVIQKPTLLDHILNLYPRLPNVALEELKKKLGTLFRGIKSSKLAEAATITLDSLKKNPDSEPLLDLMHELISALRNKEDKPKLYVQFLDDLEKLIHSNQKLFLKLAVKLEVIIIIDVFLFDYKSSKKFDAVFLEKVIEELNLTVTSFLIKLSFSQRQNQYLELCCEFALSFFLQMEKKISEIDYIKHYSENIGDIKEFPFLSFFVTLLLAENMKKTRGNFDDLVLILRKMLAGISFSNEAVWEWILRLRDLDKVVFTENLMSELSENKKAMVFDRLSKSNPGRRF